jgi:hypothetical protein
MTADLASAREYPRTAPPVTDDFSTESYLRAITCGEGGPAEAAWARSMADRLEPRAARNTAIREAAKLLPRPSISATAREVERWLARYVLEIWPLDQECGGPSEGCGALRLQLWRVVRQNSGRALRRRQVLRILEQD